jgi:cystathionine beta-synthase
VGGSSGSALSGALRYLHSPAGLRIASDPTANVILLLPDGVRNYMSKPWFLAEAEDDAMIDLRLRIKGVICRELGDPGAVVQQAEDEGVMLQKGEGVMGRRESEESRGTLVGSYEGVKGLLPGLLENIGLNQDMVE